MGGNGFSELREHFGLKVGKWNNVHYSDYNNEWKYHSTKIKTNKTGLLTSYPWKIAKIDNILTIPETHTTSNAAHKDIA